MIKEVKQEVEKLIEELELNCSVKEFKDKVDWYYISESQKLSEKFIKEFKDKVNWNNISYSQKLSEKFIKEFKDKVNWSYISHFQKLSEKFIREFKDKINWFNISKYQKLSEKFIREFKDKVSWDYISYYQKLSEEFIKEFKDKVNGELYKKINRKIFYSQKIKEVKAYCKKYDLTFDYKNRCFYAFRNHDNFGRGMFNKTIFYKKNIYYKDWKLDMRKDIKNSFGMGIFSKGNTKVKVLIKDWGVKVDREDSKCRVWGFEVV